MTVGSVDDATLIAAFTAGTSRAVDTDAAPPAADDDAYASGVSTPDADVATDTRVSVSTADADQATSTRASATVPVAALGHGTFTPPVTEVPASAAANMAAPPVSVDDANMTADVGDGALAPSVTSIAVVGASGADADIAVGMATGLVADGPAITHYGTANDTMTDQGATASADAIPASVAPAAQRRRRKRKYAPAATERRQRRCDGR